MDVSSNSSKVHTNGIQGELGEWLEQLQSMSADLDTVRSGTMHSRQGSFGRNKTGAGTQSKQIWLSSPSINATPGPPPVPPKPPIDSVRYSMANMEASADVDLDVLLDELYALEDQLNNTGMETENEATGSKQIVKTVKTPAVPVKPSIKPTADIAGTLCQCGTKAQSSVESFCNSNRAHSPDTDSAFCDSSSMLSSESSQSASGVVNASGINAIGYTGNGGMAGNGIRDAQKECRRSDASSATDDSSGHDSGATHVQGKTLEPVQTRIPNVELEMKHENACEEERNARIKTEKIKVALQKMKEASVKKLYVKVFSPNGNSKNLLVDEQWTVAYALQQLAQKHLIHLGSSHAIVEYLPDLYMERIYEDHEMMVENLLMWTRDSPNKLYFVQRPEKYHLFSEPQVYLLNTASDEKGTQGASVKKQQIIEEFFSLSHVQPPEIEGPLYLKWDGKKTWKKLHFVLRASGLYYIPKGKTKGSKDLVCLMNLDMVQVYNGIGWKKKYKAPTDHGFALKHPQIQVKASTYIKYLCAEDEKSHQRWLTGLRIAKNGRALLENYQMMLELTGGETAMDGSRKEPELALDTSISYCKESIVMRPTRQDLSTVLASPASSRRLSADIARNGHQRRTSGTLTRVDIPVLPAVTDHNGSNGAVGAYLDSPVSTPDSQSVNGFDTEFSTGTIKKKPNSDMGPCKILPAYARGSARFPLTESTKNIHSRNFDQEWTSGHNGSSRSLNEEMDSDEEVGFAPPPPPLPQADSPTGTMHGGLRVDTEQGSKSTSSMSPVWRNGMDNEPSQPSLSSSSMVINHRQKKAPPAPPKRSETTHLSTSGPMMTLKPKPAIPEKPKFISAPVKVSSISPTAADPGSNAFQSELQRAMQKRLRKMEEAGMEEEKTAL